MRIGLAQDSDTAGPFMPLIRPFAFAILFLAGAAAAFSGPTDHYALILRDAPAGTRSQAALQRAKLAAAQESLRSVLRDREVPVTGSTQTLLNAVFVIAPSGKAAELRELPGVAAVAPMPRLTRKLNKAVSGVNAAAGWQAIGGAANAGAGIKIAILDSGIDETHPGFQDAALAMPPGFPKTGNADDAIHATNKIIAVRSLVSRLAFGNGTPESSRPDDLSARDRVGHGTAVAMIAAGVSHQSPLGVISGVAPKAWLGNYKIFGSPGLNDSTTADVVLQALELAFTDGMDVALLCAGDLPAEWSPEDQGADCGLAAGAPCDPWAAAVSTATAGGMVIVAPAGNDGDYGWTTINTPGDSPAVITVGAVTNAHAISATVSTSAGNRFQAQSGDGPQLSAPLSAPLFAISTLDATELGCQPYPARSLTGLMVLVTAGQCSYATKVLNAQAAGAIAALIVNQPGQALSRPTGLTGTAILTAVVDFSSGAVLKSYVKANPGAVVTFNPAPTESTGLQQAVVAQFSSRGPAISRSASALSIKPDLVAPGASIYTAAQAYDPNGDLYNATRYVGVDGTSFAAAFVAGAAALVKQANPAYSAGQIKSALTNTASSSVNDSDANGSTVPARAMAVGAGMLDAGAAVASTLTIEPASVSFGALRNAPPSRSLAVKNTGTSAATIQVTVQARDVNASGAVSVSPSTLMLAPGQSASVAVTLSGNVPPPGIYEGVISISGGAVPLRVPYLYLVGSETPTKLIPLRGRDFVTEAGSGVILEFRVVDSCGVPVAGLPVRFAPSNLISGATPSTDNLGVAQAFMHTQNSPGEQGFTAVLLGNAGSIKFDGRTRAIPRIAPGGVVDAASSQVPDGGFAPGSYVTIFGSGLSESTVSAHTPSLPLSLAGVSVSFDAGGTHAPGRLWYVSDSQVSVQVPWELAGLSSATTKVTLSHSQSRSVRADNINLGTYQTQTFTIPIGAASPAFFEYADAASGQTLAVALDQTGRLAGSANPVRRGSVVQLFMNGLGPVLPGTQPASGDPATGAQPLATTTNVPSVTIGGRPGIVEFSGLAPFLVGLYQVNAFVPQETSPGIQPVILTIAGISSKPSALFVQ